MVGIMPQIDQNGQLVFQNAHILGVMGFIMIASCLDNHYRQTYSRSTCSPRLGARRAVKAITRRARNHPTPREFRWSSECTNRDVRQDRGGLGEGGR